MSLEPPAVVVLLLLAVGNLVLGAIALTRQRGTNSSQIRLDMLAAELRSGRTDAAEQARAQREDLLSQARAQREELQASLLALSERTLSVQTEMRKDITASGERVREGVAIALRGLQEGNEKKLEEMRATVDEKLQGALERRLGESFTLVSERLEAVQRGLGEMQQLATGVGDLKRVLSNVSTRGSFGELQLRAILEQMLAPEQYVANFQPNAESSERVEFAIVLPGRDGPGSAVYLPIDSKFPQEDYLRLLKASDLADSETIRSSRAALGRQVRQYARDVADKYVHVPQTTDFAIIFLPTEGLYAEILREPGLMEELQSTHRVTLTGPTTLAAFLSSLRMGFRTLAIQERSGEVRAILGAVKTEFGKFGDVIDKAKKQLAKASRTLDQTSVRTRAMERRLREVEELPATEANGVLDLVELEEDEVDGEDGQVD